MARFNEETPDDPNVRYFSYGAYFLSSSALVPNSRRAQAQA
jgi:hypothetical protein